MKKATKAILMATVLIGAFAPMRVSAEEMGSLEISEVESSEQEEIFITMIHTDLVDVVYKEGVFTQSNPRTVAAMYYVVKTKGETMQTVARRLHVTEEYLMSANPDYRGEMEDELALQAFIEVPETEWPFIENISYIVRPGDCLSDIAMHFYTSVEELMKQNPWILDPDMIHPDDVLCIS